MSVNKILSISIIFVSAILLSGNCHAYNSESGLDENETFHADYSLWYEDWHWHSQDPSGTYIYAPDLWRGNTPIGVLSWSGWIITCFLNPETNLEIPTTWTLQGKTYNEVSENYEDKGTEFVTGYLMEVSGGSEVTKKCEKNVIQEYFTNDTTRADNFIGTEQDSNHPDYVEVNMSVGSGMEDIEHTEEYGITMSGDEAEACAHHGTGQDLGFGSGRGGAGGTGELYNRVVYNDESGSKQLFVVIFYGVIPLIFLMYGFRMIGKITSSYGKLRR